MSFRTDMLTTRFLATLAILLVGALLLTRLLPGEIRGGEEGRHAVMADHVRREPAAWLHPSAQPGGPPSGTSFFHPWLGAMALRLPLAPAHSLKGISWLAVLLAAWGLCGLLPRERPLARLAAVMVWLSHPGIATLGVLATPDALALSLSILGLWSLASRREETPSPTRAMLSGVLFGLSWLCRPWMGLPAAGAALVLLSRPRGHSSRRSPARVVLLGFFVAYAAIALSPLALDALLTPGIAGVDLRALAAAFPGGGVLQPPGAPEALTLFLEHSGLEALAIWLPLIALGLIQLVEDPGWERWMVVPWLGLSIAMHPGPGELGGPAALGAIALLAARGMERLEHWAREEQWAHPASARLFLLIFGALLPLAGIAWRLHEHRWPVSEEGLFFSSIAWSLTVLLVAGRHATLPVKCVVLALALLPGSTRLLWATRAGRVLPPKVASALQAAGYYPSPVPGLRAFALRHADAVQPVALEAVAFISQEPEPLEFYWNRRGLTWEALARSPEVAAMIADGQHGRLFLVPAEPRGDEVELAWQSIRERLRPASPSPEPMPFQPYEPDLLSPSGIGPVRPQGQPVKKAILHDPPQGPRYRRL